MENKIEIIEVKGEGKVIYADGKKIELDAWDRKAMIQGGLDPHYSEHISEYLEWLEKEERHLSL